MRQEYPAAGNGKKTKILKKVLFGAACALMAAAIFFAGFFTYRLTLDDGLRSLLWFKEQIQREYYGNISDEAFWDAAISGAEGLLDDYSRYYTADEYEEMENSVKGISVGCGLSFFADTNKIYKVALGSPAFYARGGQGGRAEEGMYLTGVGDAEGELQDTFTAEALSKALSSVKEGQRRRLRLSASSASAVQDCIYLDVVFERYTESYVLYATAEASYAALYEGAQGTWQKIGGGIASLSDGQAYIRLVQFSGNAAAEFAAAARQYKEDGCTSLLLDLRNNGGGSLSVLQGIAPYLAKDASGRFAVLYAEGYGTYYAESGAYAAYFAGSEICVAANRNTASASEALMGLMLCYGTVEYEDIYLVRAGGSDPARTYGKGIMQSTFVNGFTGEAAKLTTARIYWPDGLTCIQGRGITSDDGAHCIDAASNADYGDPALEEILQKIAARGSSLPA